MRKKMKKTVALLLAVVMTACVFTGCQTKSDVEGTTSSNSSSDTTTVTGETVTVRIAGLTAAEKTLTVLRDQLIKAGFDVELNLQPDFSSLATVLYSGEYDICMNTWVTTTGSPDYSVRAMIATDGIANITGIYDLYIDELLDLGASQTPEEYYDTYKALEEYVIDEMAYMLPLYSGVFVMAYNNEVLDADSMVATSTGRTNWSDYEYVDESWNDTRVLYNTQTMSTASHYYTITDVSSALTSISYNTDIRLVNLSVDSEIVTDDALSYEYAIVEGNTEFYFILRDDVNFAKVVDYEAVDTGVLVAAEDAVYSIQNAMDVNSVPTNQAYTNFQYIDTIEVYTDIEALESEMVSGTDTSVYDYLNAATPTDITSLEETKDTVDNESGNYQIVKITTTQAFPQILNYLTDGTAGIVCAEQVELFNGDYDIETYDATTDILYGDASTITLGDTYDNQMWFSGAYAIMYRDDYEIVFEKNPNYMVGTEYEPEIKYITTSYISETTSATAALRSGEIDIIPSADVDTIDLLNAEDFITTLEVQSTGASYMAFNMVEGTTLFTDSNLRHAVLYAINQDDFIAVYNGYKSYLYSLSSPIIDTGNVLVQDLDLSAEYLSAYYESLAE